MNSRVGRLGGHSHDSRNLTFLFRSREATTHRVYLNEVDTPLRYIGSRSARQPDGLPAFEAEEFFDHGTVEDRDREQV